MIDDIIYTEGFLAAPAVMFDSLLLNIDWDSSMAVRKTASYGVAYNYSQMTYPWRPMPALLNDVCRRLEKRLGFLPNNCLLNYYPDGNSKMGFHADQTDILADNTGVGIISLGTPRTLRFRQIEDKDIIVDYILPPGSLLYMPQAIQLIWQHAVLKSDTRQGRISLTLRKIKA